MFLNFKITFLYKCFVTLTALVWFLTTVCSHMCKINFLNKSFVTQAALVWFLPTVYSHMIYKITFCKKALSHWLH